MANKSQDRVGEVVVTSGAIVASMDYGQKAGNRSLTESYSLRFGFHRSSGGFIA